LVVAGSASRQNCSRVPVKVLSILVDTSELLNKGLSEVKFERSSFVARLYVV